MFLLDSHEAKLNIDTRDAISIFFIVIDVGSRTLNGF